MTTSVPTLASSWNFAPEASPTTVVVATVCPAPVKLMFDVSGQTPTGHTLPNPAAAVPVTVSVINTARASGGTPLEFKVASIVRPTLPTSGDLGPTPVGFSPGLLS